MPRDFVDELEHELRGLAQSLAEPHQTECMLCFTARAIKEFGCDTTLRWAARFRKLRAPRAKGLERRLGRIGGYCDCEIFFNGYQLRSEHLAVDPQTGEHVDPVEFLPCLGVRRGSTQGCALWERRSRGW